MNGPLSDLLIIEMAALGPVPLAGQLLADLGAQVIIIDRKSEDSASVDINRRNKQSIALNLKTAQGIEALLKLLHKADILLEGFRPGVMEKLGIAPADCQAVNQRLIYGRMTGWGQQGPLAQTAGHDINYLAITGALHAIGKQGEPPIPPLNLVADYAGGAMFLVMGVLAALQERQQSGRGQVVDAAMVDGVPSLMGFIQTLYQQQQWLPTRGSNMLDGGAPYYRCYETADQKNIAVGPIEPQFFKRFVELAGLPATDLLLQNNRDQWPAMHKRYEQHFRTKSRDQWMSIFEGSDACVSPVLSFDEAPQYPHNKDRNVFMQNSFQASPAPRFNRTPAATPTAPITAGASTDEVLGGLGYSENELAELRKLGVIS